jgi:oligosaccharyltransferase complex subunit alpha (ribophorin I)
MLLLFIKLVALSIFIFHISNGLVNRQAKRMISINSSIVREEIQVVIQADLNETVNDYIIVAPKAQRTMYFEAIGADKVPLKIEQELLRCDDEKYDCFRVELSKPLLSGEKQSLTIMKAHVGLLRAMPKAARLGSEVYYSLSMNAFYDTIYETVKQKTLLKYIFPFVLIIRYIDATDVQYFSCQEPYDKRGSFCGLYSDIKGLQYSPLNLEFISRNIAPLEITNMKRALTVLPWTNQLLVKEEMNIKHIGSSLKNEDFSKNEILRISSLQHFEPSVISSLTFKVDRDAMDIKLQDELGINWTLNKRSDQLTGEAIFDFQPRYPLVGGWEYFYTVIYSLPLSKRSSSIGKSTKSLSIAPFEILYDIPISKYILQVDLPEDASNADVRYPFMNKISWSVSTHRTYFSSVGEKRIEINANGMVREHMEKVEILYDYPIWGYLRKPMVILFSIALTLTLLSKNMIFNEK